HSGKSEVGNVAVRAYHRGNHIYIEVEDDGRGIDYDRVRSTAIEAGLVSADDAQNLDERALLEFLFHPGFSTAPRKTELAGRGVGLDVVRANLNQLNGEIEIETQKGVGTRFTLKVPLTLIISQALFVRCGKDMFAFPLAFVEEIRRLKDTDLEEVGVKLFPGATIAPDGSLILLVDLNRLIMGEAIERRPLMAGAAHPAAARIFAPGAAAVAHGAIPPEAIDVVPDEKVIVLADDSISV